MLREQIYNLIKKAGHGQRASRVYDVFIMAAALLSLSPLMFKESNKILETIDVITVYILFFDYIFRWMTYDYASKRKAPGAFVLYPFTPMAIVDLVSLLPSLGVLGQGFRILRLLRIFKLFRYSKSFSYIANAFKKEGKTLWSVVLIAVFYIFVSALLMFSNEPQTFNSFFDALYWATTALTTVGYGDIYPVTELGKFISMVSSLFGIAVIALPAGIITASFVEEINLDKARRAKELEAEGKDPNEADNTSSLERILGDEEKEEDA